MKNGKMVAKNLETEKVTDQELIELMMGEVKTSNFKKDNKKGDVKLEVKDISLTNSEQSLNHLTIFLLQFNQERFWVLLVYLVTAR